MPGFARGVEELLIDEIHPWPWLRRQHGGPLTSFTAWRRRIDGSVATAR